MDGHDIMFESMVKVEKVEEEPAEFFEEANPIDIHKTSTSKSVIKKEEDEELEPLVTVFLKSSELTKEEVEEECEDPLATDPLATNVGRCPIKSEETDERACSRGE
ncbi:hypothetical protein R5R35_004643 [Gryllus longicercus]|uniref:Uncharacterized protein n=1 Tax=Gryllus longicercus TaxID=2509291 RepID=A0AAN9VYT7_9ORTH